MPQSKRVHAKYMKTYDRGSQNVTHERWETITVKEVKEILPAYLVKEVEALVVWDELLGRAITLEERWGNAYQYHVWYEGSFINGIHKDSKYRGMIKE